MKGTLHGLADDEWDHAKKKILAMEIDLAPLAAKAQKAELYMQISSLDCKGICSISQEYVNDADSRLQKKGGKSKTKGAMTAPPPPPEFDPFTPSCGCPLGKAQLVEWEGYEEKGPQDLSLACLPP